jgi:superoxide dismutase, Cu-Zn family
MKRISNFILAVLCFSAASAAIASSLDPAPMSIIVEKSSGKSLGTITITQTDFGLLLSPNLHDLSPGMHAFEIYKNSSCDVNALAAGGHLDPHHTGKHLGPYNKEGHLGDLPALYVSAQGRAFMPVLAPRIINLAEVTDHALVISSKGVKNADEAEKATGNDRNAICGVIE